MVLFTQHRRGGFMDDDQLLESARIIIEKKRLVTPEQLLINLFSELISSSLQDYLSDLELPIQQEGHPEG